MEARSDLLDLSSLLCRPSSPFTSSLGQQAGKKVVTEAELQAKVSKTPPRNPLAMCWQHAGIIIVARSSDEVW
jgi:hypothetical protein